MKDFVFNNCGICINPNTPVNHADNNNYYTITTCEVAPGAWVYGLAVHCEDRGFGFGSSIPTKTTYGTEEKATSHALREVRDYLSRNINVEQKCHPNSNAFIRAAKKMVKDIENNMAIYAYVQLELF